MGDYNQTLAKIMLHDTIHGTFSGELKNILRSGKIVWALRCSLMVECQDLSQIPRTQEPIQRSWMRGFALEISVLGRHRQEDPWSWLAIRTSLLDEFQAPEKPYLKRKCR